MKIRKLIAGILFAVLAFSLFGCGENGLDDISQNLTTYKIDAVYDGQNTVTAAAEIRYVNNYDVSLPELQFRLYPNAYRKDVEYAPVHPSEKEAAYPLGESYGGIEITSLYRGSTEVPVTLSGPDDTVLVVPLDSDLRPTTAVTVRMEFTLTIPQMRHRFGMTENSTNLGNWYPIASVYENGAFRSDPYYANGDPFYSEIANYEVKLTVPGAMTVAATGTVTSAEAGETTVYTATAKAVRDFAAVIGGFETATAAAGNTQVMYYYYSDPDPAASLAAAADALTVFGEKFGAYPYETFSVVQTGFLQGGMEYPQLVMISDALVPEVYREAVIHETAHQWFYGLVGSDQIGTPWLDEALAEYCTDLFYKWRPDYEIDFEKKVSDTLSAFVLYCDIYKHGGRDDTSMNRALGAYENQTEYTYMTYVKGSLMLDSLRRTIGDDAFTAALKAYVSEYYLENARPDCLIACFEKASGKELKSYFDSWTSGKVKLFAD